MMDAELKCERNQKLCVVPAASSTEAIFAQIITNAVKEEDVAEASLKLKRNFQEESTADCDDLVSGEPPLGSGQTMHTGTDVSTSTEATAAGPPIDIGKAKRQRRSETLLLFSHPFFNLLEDGEPASSGDAIAAKCVSCEMVLRGHKNTASHFVTHMKRSHPDLYKTFESLKPMKVKGGAMLVDSNGTMPDANATDLEPTSPPPLDEDGAELSPMPTDTLTVDADTKCGPVLRPALLDDKQAPPLNLSAKALVAVNHMLDQKLAGFVTKAELHEERLSIMQLVDEKLERSLLHSTGEQRRYPSPLQTPPDGSSLQTQVNLLTEECKRLRAAIAQAYKSKEQLQKELTAIDRTSRQHKLVIHNVPITNIETPKEAMERLLRDRFQLMDVVVVSAVLLSKTMTTSGGQSIVVELQSDDDAKAIQRNCFRLKETGILVEQELSSYDLKRKQKLLILRKELLRRNPHLKVVVRSTILLVSGKQFYWDDVEGLCTSGALQNIGAFENPNAVEELKEVTGLDMSEFLSVLKNYNLN